MKIEDLAKEHYLAEQTLERHTARLLRELIEKQASEKDGIINNQLMKKLVIFGVYILQNLKAICETK